MAYRMTAARRAALRRAQAASARKRRGKGKGKLAAANRRATRNKRIALAAGGLAGAAALAGYANSRSLKATYKRDVGALRNKNRKLTYANAVLRNSAQRYHKKYSSRSKPTKVYSERVRTPQLALPRGSS